MHGEVYIYFKGDLKDVGKSKGWCPYYLARYTVSTLLIQQNYANRSLHIFLLLTFLKKSSLKVYVNLNISEKLKTKEGFGAWG